MFAEFLKIRAMNLKPGLVLALMLCLSACSTPLVLPEQNLPPSQLIESSDLQDVQTIALQLAELIGKEQILVIYDLDNTLLAMEQDLGSDQWYDWQKNLQAADRCDPGLVTDRLAAQGALYYASAMRLTQPDGADIVRSVQDQGFNSIILTSRGADFSAATLRELHRNGFDFTRHPIGNGGVLRFKPTPDSRETLYENGVYLTAGQNKGEMLLALLQATGTALPKAMVMADDKPENLQHVLEALAGQATSVQALRYNREDARVAAFDGGQTVAQWRLAEPALLQLQALFGSDNFELPLPALPEGCPATEPVTDSAQMNTSSESSQATTLRIATFNIAMGFEKSGQMGAALQDPQHQRLREVAAILQTVRPDIVLLNEFDFDAGLDAAGLLNRNFLAHADNDREAIEYPYHFRAESNTGIASGLDIDGDGKTDGPADAWGFGHFPGQYGMLLLSRFPIDSNNSRTFQNFPWSQLAGARRPMRADGSHFYTDETWQQLRLSSKSHWDVSVQLAETTLHVLAYHPTPPVFDGPENRNGLRNFDEIRFWADYLRPEVSALWTDDQGRAGGLSTGLQFVVLGDFNADPNDGDSLPGASEQLLEHERVNAEFTPTSNGAEQASLMQGGLNIEQQGNPAADTADFNDRYTGNLRLDYVLPSNGLKVLQGGVFWPAADEPGYEWVDVSDHHLVWLDVQIDSSKP
jgi:endonuclease/exonuclease/phosphatase family metal-dependent hydrolase